MDATVSARIPVELRNQAARKLQEIGATPTRLINAAFEFVVSTGSLPEPVRGRAGGVGAFGSPTRRLTEEQRAAFVRSLAETSLDVPAEALAVLEGSR